MQTRYGAWKDVFTVLDIFSFFQSPLFLSFFSLLALSNLICSLDRWKGVWRKAFRKEWRITDSFFERVGNITTITLPIDEGISLISDCLEQRGYRIRHTNSGEKVYLWAERNRLAFLATLVTHLSLIMLLIGVLLGLVWGWRESLVVGPGLTTSPQNVEDISIQYQGFSIDRYANGNAADYEVGIRLLTKGQKNINGIVRLNAPLTYQGVSYYLHSYLSWEDDYLVRLLVVHDPGYTLVVLGGFLLLFGMCISFNFPYATIYGRFDREGSLHLAGWAGRRAYSFQGEFEAILRELNQKAVKHEREGMP